MKYIRTKDAIYWNIFDGALSPQTWIGEPIAEADTIEELFDEYLYVNKEKDIKCFCLLHQPITTIYYGAKLEDIETKKLINDKNVEIYGAIWTDKGLIYKAKMKGILSNDEIDWELL